MTKDLYLNKAGYYKRKLKTNDALLWDFGDNNHSTKQWIKHKYKKPGIYTMKLFLENKYGCKDSSTQKNWVNYDTTYEKHIIFVIDASESLKDHRERLKLMKKSIRLWFPEIGIENSIVTVLASKNKIDTIIYKAKPNFKKKRITIKGIDKLRERGSDKNLISTLKAAYQISQKNTNEYCKLIFLTDGGPFGGITKNENFTITDEIEQEQPVKSNLRDSIMDIIIKHKNNVPISIFLFNKNMDNVLIDSFANSCNGNLHIITRKNNKCALADEFIDMKPSKKLQLYAGITGTYIIPNTDTEGGFKSERIDSNVLGYGINLGFIYNNGSFIKWGIGLGASRTKFRSRWMYFNNNICIYENIYQHPNKNSEILKKHVSARNINKECSIEYIDFPITGNAGIRIPRTMFDLFGNIGLQYSQLTKSKYHSKGVFTFIGEWDEYGGNTHLYDSVPEFDLYTDTTLIFENKLNLQKNMINFIIGGGISYKFANRFSISICSEKSICLKSISKRNEFNPDLQLSTGTNSYNNIFDQIPAIFIDTWRIKLELAIYLF